MNDIQYFIIYLRDISDYHTVDRMMQQFYPQIPRIIVEAKVCRPGWLIEMECIAEKNHVLQNKELSRFCYLTVVGILLSLMISFPAARASSSTGLDVKSGVL